MRQAGSGRIRTSPVARADVHTERLIKMQREITLLHRADLHTERLSKMQREIIFRSILLSR